MITMSDLFTPRFLTMLITLAALITLASVIK